MRNYYQNKLQFKGVFSRHNLPKIKVGAYIINLDEFKSKGTHWMALSANGNNIIYFDSFGIEHIPNEIKKIHRKQKNVIINIYRIQSYDSIMCGYLCI